MATPIVTSLDARDAIETRLRQASGIVQAVSCLTDRGPRDSDALIAACNLIDEAGEILAGNLPAST